MITQLHATSTWLFGRAPRQVELPYRSLWVSAILSLQPPMTLADMTLSKTSSYGIPTPRGMPTAAQEVRRSIMCQRRAVHHCERVPARMKSRTMFTCMQTSWVAFTSGTHMRRIGDRSLLREAIVDRMIPTVLRHWFYIGDRALEPRQVIFDGTPSRCEIFCAIEGEGWI